MCGIAGFFSRKHDVAQAQAVVQLMTDSIKNRGPDDSGSAVVSDLGGVFGHLRLSILDLSPLGRQPMVSKSGRFTITYNGEVYNFADIKKELVTRGHSFKSSSDTEVMLAAFEEYGVVQAISHFNGMFAFAVWDKREKVVTLVRDRFGVKPLYYGLFDWGFAFASELKPFHHLPDQNLEIDHNAAAKMIQFGYVPAPLAIYKNIYKLPPGHSITLPFRDQWSRAEYLPHPYWNAKEKALAGLKNKFSGTFAEGVDSLHDLLLDSVKLRMISDVPLGVFLSGGIDSSVVTALMQAASAIPVKSFSIGFTDDQYNEAKFAAAVAKHIGTDHTELYVTAEEARKVIPGLPHMYDEPFADSSQIPTFLVSKLARQKVTVSLSGDGGDELFGGYSRFFQADKIWKIISPLPHPLRSVLALLLESLPPQFWDLSHGMIEVLLPQYLQTKRFGEKVWRLAQFLNLSSREDFYEMLLSFFSERCPVISAPLDCSGWRAFNDKSFSFFDQMMLIDALTYLPDDILVKVDRASMAVSLEAREPLLDYRVFELAYRMPREWMTKEGKGKYMLRKVLHRYVPESLVERPKMGFGVPLGEWLSGPLKSWAEDIFSSKNYLEDNFFNHSVVKNVWNEHTSGARDHSPLLWNIISYLTWKSEYQS
jgi:asparagine synthase (glutamine-hydrolysing)